MATVKIEGNTSTVTVIEIDPDEGILGLYCSMGQACRNYRDISDFRSTNWADVINEADIHADLAHGDASEIRPTHWPSGLRDFR